MNAIDIAEAQLKKDEDFRQFIYILNGVRHIGYGFNLDNVGLYKEECDFILNNRCSIAINELQRNFPGYIDLSVARQAVLINLVYNLGITGLMAFSDFVWASREQDWNKGARALLDSLAHNQNPARMERLAYQWEMDKM